MKLAAVKTLVKSARDRHGVSWYLRDTGNPPAFDECFALIVYDDSGNVIERVEDIRPDRGLILPSDIMRIGKRREMAGMNSGFVFAMKKAGEDPEVVFETERKSWIEGGRDEWMAQCQS